jgi:hypothetical protein
MGEHIVSQGRERGSSVFDSEASSSYAPENALLALELRFDPLEATTAIPHPTESIAVGIVPHGTLCGEGGDVQERHQLDNGSSARGKRLSRLRRAGTPRARAQLL